MAAERAPGELLDWDSEFWDLRVGRVATDAISPSAVRELDDWAAAADVACVFFLASGDDPSSQHAAEDGGFRLMDVRVELRRERTDDPPPDAVRPAVAADRDALVAIARTSHRITRFYADPQFPRERCDDLYETWIARSLDGWADVVLTAGDEGAPLGYVSCHLDAVAARGSIGLIAVSEEARRSGLGLDLTRAAVAWCSEQGAAEVTVVTQGRNIGALRTFQRAGFAPDSLGLWFHKWYAG